jgi:imidazolonepropionase-like amidohydrolase
MESTRGIFRSILNWVGRVALGLVLPLAGLWVAILVPRAYYRRQAAKPSSAFIVEDAPVIALIHARVIDGTGSSAMDDQTIVISGGKIVSFGASSATEVPQQARVIDLFGKTIIPGLVMMHEHLFTTSSSISASIHKIPWLQEEAVPFPLMYLAAGVTTIRTTGSIDGDEDLAVKHAIDTGQRPRPELFLTAPYLEGKPTPDSAPHYYPQMRILKDAEDAKQTVDLWASKGMTSFKAYMNITPEELKAAIDEAHGKNLKITGHLCSVGFTEAADLGIDNIEHGLPFDEEFYPDKLPGVCPDLPRAMSFFDSRLDVNRSDVRAMTLHLVDKGVAITSTLAVAEDLAGAPQPLSSMTDREERALGWRSWLMYRMIRNQFQKHSFPNLLTKEMQFERDFAASGGLLLAGCDPTGDGGTLAGYGDQREIELLVQAGFSPVEAIHIATENGAKFLGQSGRIGTIAIGKQADLVVIAGDPSKQISDIRRVEVVFKKGVGYSSPKLFRAVSGLVGVD